MSVEKAADGFAAKVSFLRSRRPGRLIAAPGPRLAFLCVPPRKRRAPPRRVAARSACQQAHPERLWATMELSRLRRRSRRTQDATPDYPQPRGSSLVLRLRHAALGRECRAAHAGSPDPAAGQRPGRLFGLRQAPPGLRPVGRAAFRVRALVADRRGLRLHHAPRELPEVRRDGRACSLVVGQEPADDRLPVVPGSLGAAALVAGSRYGVPHDLGARPRFGAARRALGAGSPRFSRAPRPWASTRSNGVAATTT